MQILAPTIMLVVTSIFAALFFIPAIRFPQKDKVANFYWTGVWVFLGSLVALSGAEGILKLYGVTVSSIYTGIITGCLNAFVIFVMFAWFRLCGLAILQRYIAKS